MERIALIAGDIPKFIRCEFATSDDSHYFIDGLFMCWIAFDIDSLFEKPDFTTYDNLEKRFKVNQTRLARLCEEQFGPQIDDDNMVRWYWQDIEERMYLRNASDAVLVKLSW